MDAKTKCVSNLSLQDDDYNEIDMVDICETNGLQVESDNPVSHTCNSRSEEVHVSSLFICTRLYGMCLAMATIGMAHSLLGSILLEIQLQTGAHIDKLTLLFTWSSCGRLLGSVTVGAIFDRLHPDMQLALIGFIAALCTIAIPLSKEYVLVAIAITFQGFCIGFITTGSSANTFKVVSELNRKPGPSVQTNFFAFAVGCVLGPFIAGPFLSESETKGGGHTNQTAIRNNYSVIIKNYTNSSGLMGNLHTGSLYPNVILASCFCVLTIIFIVKFSMDKCKARRSATHTATANPTSINKLMLLLFMVAFFCSIGVEITFMGMLYTYTVKVHNWLPKTANHLLMVYWIMFALARAGSIPVARYLKPRYILGASIVTMVALLILLVAANHLSHVILWVTAAGMGVATSIQMGTWFLLGNQYMPVTGRVASAFTTSIYTGCIIIPALSGLIFRYIALRWFPLILLVFVVLLLLDFIAVQCYGKKHVLHNHTMT